MIIVVGCIVYAMYLLISSRKLQNVISSTTPPKNPGKNMLSMAKDYMAQQSSFAPNPGQQFTNENPAIYFSLIAIGGGLGLFGSYKMEKKWWDENKEKQ